MYFANEKHKQNYQLLMKHYTLNPGQDIQYEASIYIAAYPAIFDCMNIHTLKTTAAPLFQLTQWVGNEDSGKHVVSAAGLTGSSTRLTEVGLSLYNGYEIGLDDVFGSMTSKEMFDVFVQACRIRAMK